MLSEHLQCLYLFLWPIADGWNQKPVCNSGFYNFNVNTSPLSQHKCSLLQSISFQWICNEALSLEYNSNSFLSFNRSSHPTGSSLHALIHPSHSPPYLSIHGGSTSPSAPSWATTTRASTTRHRAPSCPTSTAGWWRSCSGRPGCSSGWCQAA